MNATTVDYPSTETIKRTISSLKEEHKANGERKTYGTKQRESILNTLFSIHTDDVDAVRRIAAYELMMELTNRDTTTGM